MIFMICEFLKDWGGLITGIIGIIGSAFVYFTSDKKLKAQQKQINDLQLASLNEQFEQKKKAKLNLQCQKKNLGTYYLVIANVGNCAARNVRIKILTSIFGISEHCDTENYKSIQPNDVRRNIILHKCEGEPNEIDVEIKWDDDFKTDNVETRTIGYC